MVIVDVHVHMNIIATGGTGFVVILIPLCGVYGNRKVVTAMGTFYDFSADILWHDQLLKHKTQASLK